MNMVEIFGIITRQAVRRGVFHSVTELQAAITRFIDTCNDRCQPFTWTKTADDILPHATGGQRTSFTRHWCEFWIDTPDGTVWAAAGSRLIPGIRSGLPTFNGDPDVLHGLVTNPERIRILAPGEAYLIAPPRGGRAVSSDTRPQLPCG